MSLRIPKQRATGLPARVRPIRGTGILPVFSALEPLEPRALLFSWTPQEVYFTQLINRARANPSAEADLLGLNFAAGLTLAEQALLVPHEPLALSASLTASARLHSADMAARNFFDHTNPNGLTPTNRAVAAGYSGTAGENIGAGYSTVDALYRSWMAAPDERRNVLSLYSTFDANYHYDHIGPGFALDTPGALYPSYYSADFGNPSSQTRAPWLLGVVFSDTDHDNFYSIGEGASGIRVDVFPGSSPPNTSGTPTATYTTDAAGNYQLPLSDGSYTVVFTRTSDNYRVIKSASISGQNLELSAQSSELIPPPPPDDFAGAGQWTLAAAIDINSTGGAAGNGSRSGIIEVAADSDLFTFTAAKSGLTTLAASSNSALAARLRVYDAGHNLLATGLPGANPLDSICSTSLAAGQTYFLLIDSADGTTGAYTASIVAPVNPLQYLGTDGQPVNPTWLAGVGGAQPVVAFVNQLGRPIVAIRAPGGGGGGWTSTDIQQAASSPTITGDLQTWVDSRDNLLYAATASSSGLLVFQRAATGAWSFRNLTIEIAVSHNIVSNLTTFSDASGLRQIAGLDAAGHMVTYWMTGIMRPQGWRYFFTDLAARDLTRRNHPMPAITGALTSYVTQRNSLNVLSTNAQGEIILFFRPGGGLATQLWNWANLSTLTNCAALVGSITATETSMRAVNISGTDASGNLWMITWRSGEGWRSRNATAAATGASTLAPGSVTSWSNTAGAGFVAGLTTSGDIVLYRYTFTNNQSGWAYATISAAVPNAPHLTGQLRATITSSGTILIAGVTATGEVVRFTFDTSWSAENVTPLLP